VISYWLGKKLQESNGLFEVMNDDNRLRGQAIRSCEQKFEDWRMSCLPSGEQYVQGQKAVNMYKDVIGLNAEIQQLQRIFAFRTCSIMLKYNNEARRDVPVTGAEGEEWTRFSVGQAAIKIEDYMRNCVKNYVKDLYRAKDLTDLKDKVSIETLPQFSKETLREKAISVLNKEKSGGQETGPQLEEEIYGPEIQKIQQETFGLSIQKLLFALLRDELNCQRVELLNEQRSLLSKKCQHFESLQKNFQYLEGGIAVAAVVAAAVWQAGLFSS